MAFSLGKMTPILSNLSVYDFIFRTCVHTKFPSWGLYANRDWVVLYHSTLEKNDDWGMKGGGGGRNMIYSSILPKERKQISPLLDIGRQSPEDWGKLFP